MEITLTGAVGLVFTICLLLTGITIILAGTIWVFQYFIIEILFKQISILFRAWKYVVGYIYYHKHFKHWYDKQEDVPKD